MAVTQSLKVADTSLMDKIAGYNAAEAELVNLFPDTKLKTVLGEVVSDQAYAIGVPMSATKTQYEKWALDLISEQKGVAEAAEAQRQTLAVQVDTLKQSITKLESDQAAQLANLKNQHAIDLANAQAVADQKVKSIVSYIFFGIAALCMLGAIAMAVLAGSYPLFGPKAAIALGLAGVTSGATGVGIIKLLDMSVVFWGIGAIVLLIVVALVLVYANHSHAQTATNVTTPPKST